MFPKNTCICVSIVLCLSCHVSTAKEIDKSADSSTAPKSGSRTKRSLVDPGYGLYDSLLYSSLVQSQPYLQRPPLSIEAGNHHLTPQPQMLHPYFTQYSHPGLFHQLAGMLYPGYPGIHPQHYLGPHLPLSHMDAMARMGGHRRKKKKKQPKVVHITECHDDHADACHEHDSQHVISFDKDDHHDYHDDDHDYHDLDHGYDYHDYHGDDYHDHDYHDDHGDYHDFHGDYHDDHDYHDHGGYGSKKKVYKPKVVIIKKIIEQSTTTMPLPPPS